MFWIVTSHSPGTRYPLGINCFLLWGRKRRLHVCILSYGVENDFQGNLGITGSYPTTKRGTVRTPRDVLVREKGCCKIYNPFGMQETKNQNSGPLDPNKFNFCCFRLLGLITRLFPGINFVNTEMIVMLTLLMCHGQKRAVLGTSIDRV